MQKFVKCKCFYCKTMSFLMSTTARGKLNKWNRNSSGVKSNKIAIFVKDLTLDEFLFHLSNLPLAVDDIRNDIVFQ